MIRLEDGLLRRLILSLALAAAAILLVTQYVARPWAVAGNSMEPTFRSGDRLLVDIRGSRTPAVGDVVVFEAPSPGRGWLIKRVAPPPARFAATPSRWPADPTPAGEWLWVEGDHRAVSLDSRSFGAVPPSAVVGVPVFRYWPPQRWGRTTVTETSHNGR